MRSFWRAAGQLAAAALIAFAQLATSLPANATANTAFPFQDQKSLPAAVINAALANAYTCSWGTTPPAPYGGGSPTLPGYCWWNSSVSGQATYEVSADSSGTKWMPLYTVNLTTFAVTFAGSFTVPWGDLTGVPTFLLASNNLSDVNAATARTNLGLGSMATQSASAVAITGGSATLSGIFNATGTFEVGGFAMTFPGSAATILGAPSGTALMQANSGGQSQAYGGTTCASGGIQTLNAAGQETACYAVLVEPEGRLTLSSHTPVLTSSVTAVSTIYYDGFHGNLAPVYNGANDVLLAIGSNEISDTLPTSSTGVANSGGVFDEWAINVSGSLTLCHATNGSGGGWANDTGGSNTARGTGYTQLDFTTRSYPTNKNALANCYNGSTNKGAISANQATYLGTFYATANGQTGIGFGGSASGGVAGCLCLWNYYNRVAGTAKVVDNGASYSYTTSTIRQARASTGNQSVEVIGVQEDSVFVTYSSGFVTTASSGSGAEWGVGLDSTTGFYGNGSSCSGPTTTQILCGGNNVQTISILGQHTIAALEEGINSLGGTFDNVDANELDVTERY